MYLASGTDEAYMRREADCWMSRATSTAGVYGALDDYKSFSKKILIERLIASAGMPGRRIPGFRRGYVEIENVKEVGGVAVGVATAEPECLGSRPVETEPPGRCGRRLHHSQFSLSRTTARTAFLPWRVNINSSTDRGS